MPVVDVKLPDDDNLPAALVAGWVREAPGPVLLCLDAPLGWPVGLRQALENHRAGQAIHTPGSELFRRATDRAIQARLGKTPLSVGADRIAWTARAALLLLDELRKMLGTSIPLAWSAPVTKVAAIEVYPAATLAALGVVLPAPLANAAEVHDIIVQAVSQRLDLTRLDAGQRASRHSLDAVTCVRTGLAFLEGDIVPPDDEHRALALVEGWIWTPPRYPASAGIVVEDE
jgi:hypothetical protein